VNNYSLFVELNNWQLALSNTVLIIILISGVYLYMRNYKLQCFLNFAQYVFGNSTNVILPSRNIMLFSFKKLTLCNFVPEEKLRTIDPKLIEFFESVVEDNC
jgi:hypothetical protein